MPLIPPDHAGVIGDDNISEGSNEQEHDNESDDESTGVPSGDNTDDEHTGVHDEETHNNDAESDGETDDNDIEAINTTPYENNAHVPEVMEQETKDGQSSKYPCSITSTKR